jgi:hypothetical protein
MCKASERQQYLLGVRRLFLIIKWFTSERIDPMDMDVSMPLNRPLFLLELRHLRQWVI